MRSNKTKSFICFPFLLAAYPVLFLFAHNMGEVDWTIMIRPLVVFSVLTGLLWFLLSKVSGDRSLAALYCGVSLAFFNSYGILFDALHASYPVRHRLLLVLWFSLWMLCIFIVFSLRKFKTQFVSLFQTFSFLIVALVLVQIVRYEFAYRTMTQHTVKQDNNVFKSDVEPDPDAVLRDIYYIIFDSYASAGSLKETYNFDNSEIEQFLRDKGFYIASESRSNYMFTNYSMPSTLNFSYLQDLPVVQSMIKKFEQNAGRNESAADQNTKMNSVKSVMLQYKEANQLVKELQALGYTYVDLSGWHGRDPSYKKGLLSYFSDFEEMLLGMTPVKFKLHEWFPKGAAGRVLTMIEDTIKAADKPEPTFTYTHLLVPHDFIFDHDGLPAPIDWLDVDHMTIEEKKDKYIAQIKFSNQQIRHLVESILARSKVEPIIIIQADHGPWTLTMDTDGQDRIFKTEIFNAYYLPDGGSDHLYSAITPVNSFRVVLDYYFGRNLGLLDDVSYYDSESYTLDFHKIEKK